MLSLFLDVFIITIVLFVVLLLIAISFALISHHFHWDKTEQELQSEMEIEQFIEKKYKNY